MAAVQGPVPVGTPPGEATLGGLGIISWRCIDAALIFSSLADMRIYIYIYIYIYFFFPYTQIRHHTKVLTDEWEVDVFFNKNQPRAQRTKLLFKSTQETL